MINVLKKIGLSDKEIDIFLVLIEYGARPASFVAQKANINRATAYSVLKTLVKKHLVYQTIKADVIQFSAHKPNKLLDYLDNESHRLTNLKSEVEGILPDLENLETQIETWKPRFKYFEGRDGMRDLLEQSLKNKNKEIHCTVSMADMNAAIGEKYYEEEIQRRIKGGIWLYVIRSEYKETKEDEAPGGEKYRRSLRYISNEITAPDMSYYLWDGDKCAFFSSKRESYGLLIESREFYQTQKMLWDSLWSVSKTPK